METTNIAVMVEMVKRTISDARDINNWELTEHEYNVIYNRFNECIAREGSIQEQMLYLQILQEARRSTSNGTSAHGVYLALEQHFSTWLVFLAHAHEPEVGDEGIDEDLTSSPSCIGG